MFRIEDGREHFYQWDKDRRLIIEDITIREVHFCNRTDDCALRRKVYVEDGQYIVDVPNILLQEEFKIRVYAYNENYTKFCEVFEVEARNKPDNYIYTEEEIKEWEALNERIDNIQKEVVPDAVIEAAIDEYLADNPIEAGATRAEAAQIAQNAEDITNIKQTYATTGYVDKAVQNIDIPDVDLTNYYTKAQVDKKLEDVDANVDLSDYWTKAEVQGAIAQAQLDDSDIDLSEYATKKQLETAIADIELIPGPQGVQGEQGPKGDKGDKGDTGERGPQGIQGEKGATGPRGLQGERGEQGLMGIQGPVGPEGPQGPIGLQGEPFTYADFTEEQLAALQGPPGATGPAGPKGDAFTYADFTQEQLTLLQGPVGPKGDIGPAGPQGIKGEKGEKGAKGEKGEKGAPFTFNDFTVEQLELLKGEKGDTGAQGPEGPQGIQGIQGEQGDPGIYIGDEEPTDDDIFIWISGDAISEPAASVNYVDTAIIDAIGTVLEGEY